MSFKILGHQENLLLKPYQPTHQHSLGLWIFLLMKNRSWNNSKLNVFLKEEDDLNIIQSIPLSSLISMTFGCETTKKMTLTMLKVDTY